MDDTTVRPHGRTDLQQDIRTALSTARDLGPDFDDALAQELAERVATPEVTPATTPSPARAGWRVRLRRTAAVGSAAALVTVTTAWVAESSPENLAWGTVGVLALAAHVARTWWSRPDTSNDRANAPTARVE